MINTDMFGVGTAGAASLWESAKAVSAAHAAQSAVTAKHRAAATDASVNRGST